MVQASSGGDRLETVLEVSDSDFDAEVIQRSHTTPVVVDFWAPWCGPCHMLGPILETLAAEAKGAWRLAKVNVDMNQALAMRYGVQGIPAVKAFKNGRVFSEFVGAQPEPNVRKFVEELGPSPVDGIVEQGLQAEMSDATEKAEQLYRQALAAEPSHPRALLGLGRCLVSGDRFEEAAEALQKVPRTAAEREEADTLLATARFRRDSSLTGGEMAARRRLAAHPDDLEARLDLASALAAKGAHREALEGLFEVMERDGGEYRDRARRSIVDLFSLLGEGDELTKEYRPRLAALLW